MYSLYGTWGFPCEFPHSEISGSLAMCAYPKLIAAYHVLHRLLMPRHSPCALCSLTYQVNFSKYLHLISQRIFLGYFSYLKLYILIHVQFSKNKIYSYKLSITTSTSSLCYSRISYAPLLIRRFIILLASNSKLILRNMVSQN